MQALVYLPGDKVRKALVNHGEGVTRSALRPGDAREHIPIVSAPVRQDRQFQTPTVPIQAFNAAGAPTPQKLGDGLAPIRVGVARREPYERAFA